MMTATAALDATASPAVTAGWRVAQPRQRQLPESGWFFIGHNVVKALERLPRKQQATARSVLMAYCQLSSRNGNAATFSAAVRLIADMAGVSEASVKRLDYFFKVAGIMDIALVKDERGLDAPRRITLHEEPKVVAETYEELTADEIRLALPARRERPVAQHVVSVVSDTKERIKETPKETISPFWANVDRDPRSPKKEREGWEVCEAGLATEHGMDIDEVRRLRAKHEANMAKLPSGAYATPENFRRNFASLRAKHEKHGERLARYRGVGNPACYADPKTKDAAADKAKAERSRWWKQFAASTANVPNSWDEATDATRMQFMVESNEGANFLALANSMSKGGAYFAVDEETGGVAAK